jgi:hypothetical protein
VLLTTAEAAELLRTTTGAARGVLERLLVKPVNLGLGRGLGLRWYRHEILEALDAKRQPKTKRKVIQQNPFAGKTAAQIVAELTSSAPEQ